MLIKKDSAQKLKLTNKSQPQRKNRKRQLNQGKFGCFCQDRQKVRQVTMVKLLLLIVLKKEGINQHFLCIFFSCIYFREIWILCIFDVYLISQMTFKRKSCVYLILRNRPKFAKLAEICTREN